MITNSSQIVLLMKEENGLIPEMRDTFVRTLLSMAKEDRNIELMTGDLGFGVLRPFWEQLPNQFTNAGIAEQNMTAAAAGMAMTGKTVFTYSIGNFPTIRCLEQIRNDCAYQNLNVKIVCVGSGFTYGPLGISHQATEDIAVMRALPGIGVCSPADAAEADAVTRAIAKYPGTCYRRLGRGGEPRIHERLDDYELGKAIQIQDGRTAAVFSTGHIFEEVRKAADLLEQSGFMPALYSFPTIKPIDRETIEDCARRFDFIVTCEEHNITGGFGGAVAEVLAEMRHKKAYQIRIGLKDEYASEVGDQDYLRMRYGLSAEAICQTILMEMRKN